MPLHISKLGPESAPLLRNLFEHYAHDMSEWFKIDTKPDGSYSFDTSKYWNGRYQVYLAKSGAAICGFAIVGSSNEWLAKPGGHDVGEFFVLRKFRRSGVVRWTMAGKYNKKLLFQPWKWLRLLPDWRAARWPVWRCRAADDAMLQ